MTRLKEMQIYSPTYSSTWRVARKDIGLRPSSSLPFDYDS